MARRSFLDRLRGHTAVDDGLVIDLDDAEVPVLDREAVPDAGVASATSRPITTVSHSWPIKQLRPPDGMDRADYLAALQALGDQLCRTLSLQYRTGHVALWRLEGATYTMVGATGLNSAWRDHRIPRTHPAVHQAIIGEGLVLEDVSARDVHVLGLPGVRSGMYGLGLVDREPLANLVTASGAELTETDLAEIVAAVSDEVAVWAAAARGEHLEALLDRR